MQSLDRRTEVRTVLKTQHTQVLLQHTQPRLQIYTIGTLLFHIQPHSNIHLILSLNFESL